MKHTLLCFAIATALVSMDRAHASGGVETRPVRILPVGDSITQGGKRERAEHTYRLALQRLLRERGIGYDFIGSRTAGLHADGVWPDVADGVPFDPDHEGYYGAKTASVCARVTQALPSYPAPPDIVLIHLGTNDQKSRDFEADCIAPLRRLIQTLREANSNVAILLGHLNFNGSEGASTLRPLVEKLAVEMHTPLSPVITVHHYRGWNEKPKQEQSDTFDWAHPNPSGQLKMARAWLDAMAARLPGAP